MSLNCRSLNLKYLQEGWWLTPIVMWPKWATFSSLMTIKPRMFLLYNQMLSGCWQIESKKCIQRTKGPSHTATIFTTIFPKKLLWKSLPIYKTVEKIFAVVKKSCSVYGLFCIFSCSVRGPKDIILKLQWYRRVIIQYKNNHHAEVRWVDIEKRFTEHAAV